MSAQTITRGERLRGQCDALSNGVEPRDPDGPGGAKVCRLGSTKAGILLSSLDPRAPLVLDMHELGRRPGNQRRMHLSVPAPADLGTEVLGVPEGSAIESDLRLEAVMEGVLASGLARVQLSGECVRCLDRLERELEADFQELYVYPESDAKDDEAYRLDGDLLDLEPAIRDAIVLALPFQPVCREDCPGLCPQCGAALAQDPDHHHEPEVDPRWAALAQLRDGPWAESDPTNTDAGDAGPTKE